MIPRPLAVISTLLTLTHITLAADQIDPWFKPRPPAPGQVSIVNYLEALGPVWALLFFLTGVGTLISLRWRHHWLPEAHVAAATAIGMYSAAAWAGAYLSTPKGQLVLALLASTVSGTHLVVAWGAARVTGR